MDESKINELALFKHWWNLSEETLSKLPALIDYFEDRVTEDFHNCKSFYEYENSENVITCDYLHKIARKYATNYILRDFSRDSSGHIFGSIMTFEDFVDACQSGYFIDYDGSGSYATDTQQSNISIYPSDIISGIYREDFSHVIWFNK